VKVYNTITSELLADYGQSSGIRSVDWSKDSRFICGGSNDGTILIWKLSDKVNAIASSKLHSASVIDIQWNPSSNLIASADEDGNIIVSDMKLQSGSYIISQIAVFPKYQYKINSLEWISDTKFAVAAQNEEVKIWDINQLSLPVSYLRNDISENIIDLDYNSTQKIIATAGTLNGVRIFDLSQLRSSYQPIFQYSGHSSQLSSVSVRFDGTTVASADNEGKIHIWKIGESTEEYKALQDDVSDKDFSIVAASVVAKDIDFGKTLLGFPSDSVLSKFVTNNYTFPISIDSISIEGSEKERFELQKTYKNYRLLPKDSLILVIKSLNNQAGNIEADIVIYYNSLKSAAKIRANVIQNQIDIDNRHYYIGKANLDTLVSRRVTCFKNLSGQNISIKSLELQKINDDRFEFTNLTGNVISPSDSLVVEVRFTPEYVGNLSTALDIRTNYFDQTLSLLLSAEGTAPNLITADTVRLSNLICGNLQTDSIKIKNDGTGELIIKGISFSDDSYSSDLPLYFSIAAGDSAEIPIEFEAQSTGEFTTLMSIESNRTVRDITNSEITIIAVKDSLGFAFEKNVLEFSGLDENQSDKKEVKIANTGTVPIEWELPLKSENFEIISILPAITPPGTFSVATVEFKGGIKDRSPYGETISIRDGCELEHNLSLIAVIGINDAEIEVAQDIVLPELLCKDSTSYSIMLKNVGTTPLTISETIAIADNDEFEFSKDYTGSIVLPNEFLELELIYKSVEAGYFEGEVLLRTNAVNVSGGEVNINVSFRKEVISIKASEDLLTLSGLMQDQTGIVTLNLSNNGTQDVTNLSFSAMNRFEILNAPTELGVGASKDVLVRFNGGKLGITYNEELYVSDDCGNALRIKLSATVDKMPNAKLEIGSVSAYPGQTVKVPVSLGLLDQIELSGTELVSFALSFNKSLLLPKGDYVFSIDTTSKKIVIENIALQVLLSGIDIEFGAYLGDTNFTRIYVSDIEVKDGDNILVSSVNGAFTLLGVCTEGGNRFVIDTGKLQLFQNYPNPVLENTTISFFAIEQGMHEVSIYNVYGDKLEILFLQFVSPGYNEVVFDADRYPSGSYIYVFQTPSTTIKRKLQILR
jgi:WD40 repeat protein